MDAFHESPECHLTPARQLSHENRGFTKATGFVSDVLKLWRALAAPGDILLGDDVGEYAELVVPFGHPLDVLQQSLLDNARNPTGENTRPYRLNVDPQVGQRRRRGCPGAGRGVRMDNPLHLQSRVRHNGARKKRNKRGSYRVDGEDETDDVAVNQGKLEAEVAAVDQLSREGLNCSIDQNVCACGHVGPQVFGKGRGHPLASELRQARDNALLEHKSGRDVMQLGIAQN